VGIEGLNKAKFGVFLPFYALKNRNQSDPLFDTLKKTVLECEHFGFDSVWLDDHLMYENAPIMECWTTLSALASVTHKIRLGTMVTSNSFRNPALLAKMAATVDFLSNGRLEFGIGAGVQEEEHIAYGYGFSNPRDRIGHLEETVDIIKKMWSQEKTSYIGKNYRIINAACEPKPLQKPHPPLIIGGGGEKFTLKVTAKYADRFDFGFLPDIEHYKQKMKILKNHCKSVERDFDEIEKSCWLAGQIILGRNQEKIDQKVESLKPKNLSREDFERDNIIGSPHECLQKIKAYEKLGVTYFMLYFGDLPDLGSLRLFAEEIVHKN
jgi:F420-dependent oxidoreductase-like protein